MGSSNSMDWLMNEFFYGSRDHTWPTRYKDPPPEPEKPKEGEKGKGGDKGKEGEKAKEGEKPKEGDKAKEGDKGKEGEKKDGEKPKDPPPPKTVELKVVVCCEGCDKKVRRVVTNLAGVDAIKYEWPKRKITITSETVKAEDVLKRCNKGKTRVQMWPEEKKPEEKKEEKKDEKKDEKKEEKKEEKTS
eukprot:TRINITY_DN1018_c0_g4_i1.p1 TRINITY_DN1018_c0_g4~~TRINITY_DN1018_c0_g4_i1.p1  ORF type:complete len:188 (-),score=69.78 TRINITY_DN1018_c0_g4_i1:271-834(-)